MLTNEESAALEETAKKLRAVVAASKEEIEEAVAARLRNSGLDMPEPDVEGLVGMQPSARESLNMMVESFEQGDDWVPVLPPPLAAQIRYAARRGVSLEAIMRGIVIVGSVFSDLIFKGLEDRDAKKVLQYMANWQTRNSDRLMTAFATEYTEEIERLNRSPTHDLREQVKRLIEGKPADTDSFGYRLDACHIGLIVIGEKAALISRRLAETLGCDLLIVPDAEDTSWIWLGARRSLDFADLERAASEFSDSLAISVGEPREGVGGWRLSHLEAKSAAPVARIEGPGLVRHSNVALLACSLSNEATARSLQDRYLGPLDRHRDSADLRETLRVYFERSCNAASAASALGVNRHTVQRRLRRIEDAIGESPASRQAEISVALKLEHLTAQGRPGGDL